MDSLNSSPGTESRQRNPFPIEGRPQMLKDFLNDDFSSCSSNGFSSFPRRACFTTVRNLVQMDLKARDSDNAEKLLRTRFKAASKTISAFHKASEVVIKAIKLLPFSSIKAPIEPQNRTKQGILSRSLSRRLKRNFWKKRDKVENYDIKVRVMVKDIIRWESFRNCSSPLQISSIAATAATDNDTTATSSISSRNSNSNINSCSDCDFISEYLQSSGCSSEYQDVNKGEEGKECSLGEKMTRNKGHNAVGEDSKETTTYSADPKGEYPLEEKDQFSPVSVLDFPDDGDTESLFHQSLACIERRREKLLQKVRRFDSLTELEPVDLENRIVPWEKDDSSESPCDDGILLSQDDDEFDLKAKMVEKGTTERKGSEYKEVVKMARDWMNGNRCGELGLGFEYNRETYVREMGSDGGRWRKFEEEQREIAVGVESGMLFSLVEELLIDLLS